MRLADRCALGLKSLVDLLLPRRCVACKAVLAFHEYYVCPSCAMKIAYNPVSNWTLNYRITQWYDIRELQRMAAYTIYERQTEVAYIIQSLKYGRRYSLGPWMGRLAATELVATGLFDGVDALIPIPLSRQRWRKRGFNQAELIAEGISSVTGIPVWSNILSRKVNNRSQTRVEFWERYTNAQSIFMLTSHVDTTAYSGLHLMLVDDVMTTGTTMLSAIETLRQLDGIQLSTFCWAWTRLGLYHNGNMPQLDFRITPG